MQIRSAVVEVLLNCLKTLSLDVFTNAWKEYNEARTHR